MFKHQNLFLLLLGLSTLCNPIDAKPRRRNVQKRAATQRPEQRQAKNYSVLPKRPQQEVAISKDCEVSAPSSDHRHRPTHLVEKKSLLLLTHAIHKIVTQANKQASVGIKIIFLNNNKCLYQKNPDELFTPASNTKMFTAGAAFHILGPNFQFETQLLADEKSTPTKINNLYVRGGGDPSLMPEDFEKMIKTLKNRGIKEIAGNLIIDSSVFDGISEGPGWKSKGDGPIFDKSPISGLMVSHSCITVHVRPSRVPGQKPVVLLDPANGFIKIDNRARTVLASPLPKRKGPKGKRLSTLHVTRAADNTIIITGTIAKTSKQKSYKIAIARPHAYAGAVFLALLKKQNISIKGKVILGETPQTAKVVARHLSQPLSELVQFMMKTSDNLYADAFFKKMGAVTARTQGSWQNGKKAVEQFLKEQVNLSLHHVIINDGSGLSHANKISPNDLAYFLSWIYSSASFKELFIQSLPISGIDGTLRSRMHHKSTHSKVLAKTGTLRGVSSLSGFITPPRGEPLAFVIMINRKNKSAAGFKRKLEDHLCTLLAAHAFSTGS